MRWKNRQHTHKIITLILYGPSPVKRQIVRLAQKKDSSIGSLKWVHFKYRDID